MTKVVMRQAGRARKPSVGRTLRLRACLRRSTDRWESAPLLADGRTAAGDAAGDGVDRRPADHGFRYGGVAFVVACQPSVRGQPGERPLDRPSARDDRET